MQSYCDVVMIHLMSCLIGQSVVSRIRKIALHFLGGRTRSISEGETLLNDSLLMPFPAKADLFTHAPTQEILGAQRYSVVQGFNLIL